MLGIAVWRASAFRARAEQPSRPFPGQPGSAPPSAGRPIRSDGGGAALVSTHLATSGPEALTAARCSLASNHAEDHPQSSFVVLCPPAQNGTLRRSTLTAPDRRARRHPLSSRASQTLCHVGGASRCVPGPRQRAVVDDLDAGHGALSPAQHQATGRPPRSPQPPVVQDRLPDIVSGYHPASPTGTSAADLLSRARWRPARSTKAGSFAGRHPDVRRLLIRAQGLGVEAGEAPCRTAAGCAPPPAPCGRHRAPRGRSSSASASRPPTDRDDFPHLAVRGPRSARDQGGHAGHPEHHGAALIQYWSRRGLVRSRLPDRVSRSFRIAPRRPW